MGLIETDRPHFKSEPVLSGILPGGTLLDMNVDGQKIRRDAFVHTPGLVELRSSITGKTIEFRLGHDIPTLQRPRTLADVLLGRVTRYEFVEESELSEVWAQKEWELTRHPLVGETLAVCLGDTQEGIKLDFLKKPEREWRIAVRRNEKTGLHRFVTTNAVWTTVYVTGGKRKDVYNAEKKGKEEDPTLIAEVLEGPFKGENCQGPSSGCRITRGTMAPLSPPRVSELIKQLSESDIIEPGSTKDALEIPCFHATMLANMAKTAGVDVTSGFSLLKLKEIYPNLGSGSKLGIDLEHRLSDLARQDRRTSIRRRP